MLIISKSTTSKKFIIYKIELLLKHRLAQNKLKINFDLVLMPSLKDLHQDHKTIAEEGLRAFKQTNIWCYELIWNNLSFNTQCFVKLESKHIEKKVEALQEYRSQASRDYMSREFIFALAKTRGVQIGSSYAEAFEVIRLILPQPE